MKIKQTFITNSSTTAYVMIGKRVEIEEFRSRIIKGELGKLTLIKKDDIAYGTYPFLDDEEEIIKIAEMGDDELLRKYLLYDWILSTSVDWSPEVKSLKELKGINLDDCDLILYGNGGAC